MSQHLFTHTLQGKTPVLTHAILKTALIDVKNEALRVFNIPQVIKLVTKKNRMQLLVCVTLKSNYFYHITQPPILIEPEA